MNTRTFFTALTFSDRIEDVRLTEREHTSFVERVVISLMEELSPHRMPSLRDKWIVSLIRDHVGHSDFDRIAAELVEEGGEA